MKVSAIESEWNDKSFLHYKQILDIRVFLLGNPTDFNAHQCSFGFATVSAGLTSKWFLIVKEFFKLRIFKNKFLEALWLFEWEAGRDSKWDGTLLCATFYGIKQQDVIGWFEFYIAQVTT